MFSADVPAHMSPTPAARPAAARPAAGHVGIGGRGAAGRGLHSFTFQLNLSRL